MKLLNRVFVLSIVCLFSYGSANAQSAPGNQGVTANPLQINRTKIDSIDKKLIALLGERESVVKEIGLYKAKNNIPALQADRFKQVLEKAIEAGKQEGLSATFITELMNAIHKESLRIEDGIKAQKQ